MELMVDVLIRLEPERWIEMKTNVLAKFEVRIEDMTPCEGEQPVTLTSYYTSGGRYIGDEKTFSLLIKRGIVPETYGDNKVCSIGKSFKNGRWYGWSYRTLYGFQVGDTVAEGDCCASSRWTEEYLKDHPDDLPLPVGFEAKTEEDCKRMAIAFASSVS